MRLRSVFDGHAYYTTEEWITEYLREVSKDVRITLRTADEVYQELLEEYG